MIRPSFSRYHYFEITVQELQSIMDFRGQDGIAAVQRFGGCEGLAFKLKTSTISGISTVDSDLLYRIQKFGANVIPKSKPKSFFKLMFDAIRDPTLLILIGAAIISLILSSIFEENRNGYEWIEGVAILLAVLVVVFVTAFNDYTKELQFRSLQGKLDREHKFSIIRDGVMSEIHSDDIVAGDICVLNYGDVIPADGILIQGLDLRLDESSMTGESDYIHKHPNIDIMLYAGTKVMEGSGKMMTLTVGIYTKYGTILTLLGISEKEKKKKQKKNMPRKSSVRKSLFKREKILMDNIIDTQEERIEYQAAKRSVLQDKLLRLAVKIGYVGTAIAVITVVVLILKLIIIKFAIEHKPWEKKNYHDLVRYLIIGISILVVAVPEGLPLAVTIALAYSVKKMMKDHNLVRHLDACETMGNATTICSDKTGTLTTNRMTVVQFYICERLYFKMPSLSSLNKDIGELYTIGASVNSSYKSKLLPSNHLGPPSQIGNKTECALLGLVLELGESYEKIRNVYPTESFVHVFSFNSARKFMTTVIKIEEGFRMFTKGAAEIIIKMCNSVYNIDGKREPLTDEMKQRLFRKVVEIMARQGLRTLIMAHRDFPVTPEPNWIDEQKIHIDLTFICCVGIEDPVRPEVPKAVAMCQSAGIVVRMVTGDNIDTAISIALKCGIIHPNDGSIILDGKQFNTIIRSPDGNVDQDLFDQIWPDLRVLARSSPEDKYILVKHMIASKSRKQRQIVAVTGDGTNDGPALKQADVGFAMGIAGTDVAKEASDIIITDDNFFSIVKAVMWGRNVYDSIAKFLQFQLTVNVVAVIAAFIGACITEYTPLKSIQLLWVNIIMDTLASLALATEMPSSSILNRKPYGRSQSIVSKIMLKNIIGQSIFQLSILFFLLFWKSDLIAPPFLAEKEGELSARLTIVFNTLVIMTLFNEINARQIHGELNIFKGILTNKIFIGIWLATFVSQVLIVQFGGMVFSCKNLTGNQWLWCLLFGVLVLVWGFILNIIPIEKKMFTFSRGIKDPEHSSSILMPTESESVSKQSTTRLTLKLAGHGKSLKLWLRSTARIRTQLRVVKAFSAR